MKPVKRSWKTTILGMISLAFVGAQVYQNPMKLAEPETIAILASGIGLVAAKDADKSHVDEEKKEVKE